MNRILVILVCLLCSAHAQETSPDTSAPAQTRSASEPEATSAGEAEPEAEAGGARTMLGMSILGNEEAPKALVIVPWKSSQIGDGLGVRNSMDDRPAAVDREVFMREVRYYELRSGAGED